MDQDLQNMPEQHARDREDMYVFITSTFNMQINLISYSVVFVFVFLICSGFVVDALLMLLPS